MVRSLFFLFFRTLDESADKDGNFPGNVPGAERKFCCLSGMGILVFSAKTSLSLGRRRLPERECILSFPNEKNDR